MCECFRSYHCWKENQDHYKSSVFNHLKSSRSLFWSYWMTLILYTLLYTNHHISADSKDSFVEDFINIKEQCTKITCPPYQYRCIYFKEIVFFSYFTEAICGINLSMSFQLRMSSLYWCGHVQTIWFWCCYLPHWWQSW